MGRFTILIALAVSSSALSSTELVMMVVTQTSAMLLNVGDLTGTVPEGEKLERSPDVGMAARSVPIPILTLIEGVSSFSQSNPPKSKTMFVLRVLLPQTSSHPRIQEYIRFGQDPSARKVFECTRSAVVDSAQRALFDCRLERLSFRAPLSAQSSGDVEIAVDGGLHAIVADVIDSKFDRAAFERETQSTQQTYFGNVLELLVFPRLN